jgi:hypothetical protein
MSSKLEYAAFQAEAEFLSDFWSDGHALVSIVLYIPHPLDYCQFMRCAIGRGGIDISASPLFLNKKDVEMGLWIKNKSCHR